MRWIAVLLAAGLSAVPAFAQHATYVIAGAMLPQERSVNGYVETVTPDGPSRVTVRVETRMDPIGSAGAAVARDDGPMMGVPRGFALPRSLAARLEPVRDAWERASSIMSWTMKRVTLDDSDREPQDAISVLRRGRGRCSGLANAVVALLRASGLAARTVSGVLAGDRGAVPHRWLECRLPGAGWVPSDPTLGLWVVTPRHIAFAAPVVDLPRIRMVSISGDGLEGLQHIGGVLKRPNRGARLICRAVGTQQGTPSARAELRGPLGEVRQAVLHPTGTFSNLRPGRWELIVREGARVIERRIVTLRAGSIHSVAVSLERRPEAG